MQKDAAKEKFEHALANITTREYMSSKAEIVDYYKDKYGEKKWTHAIAEDLYGMVKNRKGENATIKSIQRRFQGSRLEKSSKKDETLFRDLGKKLPAKGQKLPREFKIKVRGKFNPSPKRGKNAGQERERDIELDFSGADALDFAADPDPDVFFEMYGVNGEMFTEMMTESTTVTAYV